MSDENEQDVVMGKLSRRGFLKASGAAMGTVVLGGVAAGCGDNVTKIVKTSDGNTNAETPWYGSPEVITSFVETVETEILIVGAGTSGLIAALTSAELGAKTLVIEKGASNGPMRTQLGGVDSAAQTAAGAKLNKTELVNELGRYASNHCDLRLHRMWADESGATLDWLAGHMAKKGFTHVSEPDIGDGTHGIFKMFPTHTQFVTAEQLASKTTSITTLKNIGPSVLAAAQALGATFRFETPLVQLIKNSSGQVTGAIAKNANGNIKITASKAVVLCTGGYAGDYQLFAKLNPYAAGVTTVPSGWNYNTGDGIKAGIWVGGVKQQEAVAMLFDRGAVTPGTKSGYPFVPLKGQPFWQGSQPFLKVNTNGERFCNESAPYDWPVYASAPFGGTYCMIFDADYWVNVAAFHTIGCSRLMPSPSGEGLGQEATAKLLQTYIDNGIVQQANTLGELATKLKLPADTFTATVARFNNMAASKVDTDFGKPAKDLFPVATAPFYGVTLGAMLLTTLDGLMINQNCQVIDADNNAIKGLYAAGDTTGGYFGHNYPELIVGNASGRTITQARHAVRHAFGKI